MAPSSNGVRRYNLALPGDVFDEVQKLADAHHTTVLEILRRFTKLGLLVAKLQETPDAAFLIREGATEREIVIL